MACTSGENAPTTASPIADPAAVHSQPRADGVSSATTPASTGGNRMCTTITSSRPCATAAVAGGSNA
jgi:hypothetical protein